MFQGNLRRRRVSSCYRLSNLPWMPSWAGYNNRVNGLLDVGAAMAGGILPALAWLWFWRREDAPHPEPRKLIALAFLAGMVTVALVIPIQKFVAPFLATQTLVFTAWSAIEEVMKFLVAKVTVLRCREDDESIDPVIYMVTVALGFAAAE